MSRKIADPAIVERIRAYIESDDLTDEQRAVCYQPDCFVVKACPGSGKTRTAGTRLAWTTVNWEDRRSGIAALSFTNVAWREIGRHLEFLGLTSRPRWPHFLGTIDSFVNQFLFLPFGHIVMGCNRRPEVVHPQGGNYTWVTEKLRGSRLSECYRKGCNSTSFEFGADGTVSWCTHHKRQPNCSRQHCLDVKNEMTKRGFALPADAMFWGMKTLELEGVAQAVAMRFPQIIIDEAQDTSEIQVRIIRLLANAGVQIALIGDPDQAIFTFSGARPDLFNEFCNQWTVLPLSRNFRSSQVICDATHLFAESLSEPSIAAGENCNFGVKSLIIKYHIGQEAELLPKFQSLCLEHNVAIEQTAVLAWQHATLEKVTGGESLEWPRGVGSLSKALTRCVCYRDEQLFHDAHELIMWTLLRICFNQGSYGSGYEIIGDIGIRNWRRQSWRLLNTLPSSTTPLSNWGPAVRTVLETFFSETRWPCAETLSRVLRRSNHATASRPVTDFVKGPAKLVNTICKVIHQAKGETYQAVMVVCSPGNKGRPPDIKQWLEQDVRFADARRTGYVAMTRPRKLLVLALPEGTHQNILDTLKPHFDLAPDV